MLRHSSRAFEALAFVGVGVFIVVCVAAQFLRTDLDWIEAPLSAYLMGPGGAIVKAAYVALSCALVALGFAFRRALTPVARSVVPPALFAAAGMALTVTAFSQLPFGVDPSGWHAFVHGIAAMTTFLCVTVAMLLQSWWLRADARWRNRFGFAFGWAVATFMALWIYALVHDLPRGLTQKIVIALILGWLAWAAVALLRRRIN